MVKLPRQVVWQLPSEVRTGALGEAIGRFFLPGTLVLLTGPTGIGKTDFCKGVARSFGVSEILTSPTFITWQLYDDGSVPLFHGDLDRFPEGAPDEFLWALGDNPSTKVALVEWGERLLPDLAESFPGKISFSFSWEGEGEEPDRSLTCSDCSGMMLAQWEVILEKVNLFLDDWKKWKA